ncbi:uncharacterized protein LOC131018347 [Salvia miltiorrhiza]|uniref:uncharacterized protein LOC131018347 n=1 Tax=Salvia miltiorrhiza TaxID=226208 RepID=UPI0025ABB3C5|nr:uncharacterized protein LOC131018347 [Salvia miltiorrhiza]
MGLNGGGWLGATVAGAWAPVVSWGRWAGASKLCAKKSRKRIEIRAKEKICEDAGHWWRSYKNGMTEAQRQGLTWNRFKEVVMDKYFPRSYRNQKQAEFLDLKQGTMSVTEYERKFNLLARYATRMVNTEDLKADRFLRGLRPEIRGILAGQKIVDYGLAVRRAHEVATGLEADVVPFKVGDNCGKRKFDISNKGKGKLSK